MIARLKGQLIEKSPISLVVDVQGVGYEVFIPLTVYYELPECGTAISLYIHTRMREESLKLYGFIKEADKQMFELLTRISKVGPKIALAFLSGMTAQELTQAVTMPRKVHKLILEKGPLEPLYLTSAIVMFKAVRHRYTFSVVTH